MHAVLFYSPTCPHCHDLINNHLIPLQEKYGNRFVILAFDVTQSWANEIYWGMLRHYEIPQEDWVVPIVVVQDEVLIGGDVIPPRLAQIIEEGLAGDGVDLPNLPPLLALLEEQGMLDSRYPERRIVIQSPPEDQAAVEEGAQPQEPPRPASDSAGRSDTVAVAPDTQVVEPAEPRAGEAAAGAADTAGLVAGARPPGAERPDSVEAGAVVLPVPADSLVSAGAPPSTPPSPGAESSEEAREGVEPSDTSTHSAESPVPPASGEAPADRAEAGGARPMDLAGAVEEMESRSMMDRFNQDRTGNSVSVLVLLGMLASLALRGYPPRVPKRPWPGWVVPALVLAGVGVAAYLSFIEITHAEAVCGPVGDCNTVNQSEYATLFGVLPVGVLGLLGYASILSFWAVGRWGPEAWKGPAEIAVWAAALSGTLFSLYLTFLEPFVIGATCAWCLSSAVIMTLLLWATSPLAAGAWPGVARDQP